MTSLGPPGLPPVTTIDPSQLKEFSREDLQEYLKHFSNLNMFFCLGFFFLFGVFFFC